MSLRLDIANQSIAEKPELTSEIGFLESRGEEIACHLGCLEPRVRVRAERGLASQRYQRIHTHIRNRFSRIAAEDLGASLLSGQIQGCGYSQESQIRAILCWKGLRRDANQGLASTALKIF